MFGNARSSGTEEKRERRVKRKKEGQYKSKERAMEVDSLRTDSPLTRRVVRSFLQFLSSGVTITKHTPTICQSVDNPPPSHGLPSVSLLLLLMLSRFLLLMAISLRKRTT